LFSDVKLLIGMDQVDGHLDHAEIAHVTNSDVTTDPTDAQMLGQFRSDIRGDITKHP
jgi:hypothetical protein